MGENKQKAEISIAGGKGEGEGGACKYPLNESDEDCGECTSVFVRNQIKGNIKQPVA